MDFRPTPAEETFRREVHDWLIANLPEGWGTPEYRKHLTGYFAEQIRRELSEGGRS